MITKIRVWMLEQLCNYYAKRSRYYFDKAVDLIKEFEFDEAEHCQHKASVYMMKHCGVTIDLVRMAR